MSFFKHHQSKPQLTSQQKMFIEKVYERESRRMWYSAYKILNNKELANDALQMAFEKVIKKVELLMTFDYSDSYGKISKYLLITARNTAINLNKAQRATVPMEDHEYALESRADVEAEVMTKLEMEELYEAVKGMDVIYRDVVYLRFYLDLKFKEVAEILSITESAAIQRAAHIRRLLRRGKDGGYDR